MGIKGFTYVGKYAFEIVSDANRLLAAGQGFGFWCETKNVSFSLKEKKGKTERICEYYDIVYI